MGTLSLSRCRAGRRRWRYPRLGLKGKWGHNPRISLGDIVAGVGCSARGGDNGFDVLDWPGMSQQSVANQLLGSGHAVLV